MTRFPRSSLALLSFAALSVAACSSTNETVNPLDAGTTPASDGNTGGLDTASGAEASFDVATDVPLVEIGPDGACGGTTITATARDASALLVLDKSGSMLQRPAGFSKKKWDALGSALGTSLEKVKGRLGLGLELFPFDPAGIAAACVGNCCAMPSDSAAITVPIEPGMTALPKILAAVSSNSPGGATPTAVALQRALDYFTSGAGKDVKGDKYVILATDGGPNCNVGLACDADHCTTNLDGTCGGGGNCCDVDGGSKIDCLDDATVVTALGALKTAGVKTFVIGIPGSEAYNAYLDAFATAGGISSPTAPPSYFAVNAAGDVAGLASVFDLITGSLITTCKLQLTSEPEDVNKLNVYVDGVLVPQGGADGWSLDATTHPPTIVLAGKTCESMTTRGAKVVDIKYGCPTIK